jgi:photosynthetic reaction center H subunit
MLSGLENIDLVEVIFTLFWVFFIGLVYYLQREMKREGYPLVSDRSEHITVQGFPVMPPPKEFHLEDGRTVLAPRNEAPQIDVAGEPAGHGRGAPLDPTGDPLTAGIGPGAWANRSDVPELTLDGKPRIIPMRVNPTLHVDSQDTDPRGMPLDGADGNEVGTVSDLWIDLAEPQIYFLEVRTGGDEGGQSVMVPFGQAVIDKHAGRIRVNALYSHQFANVPGLKSPDQITLLEEDKIMGYFGAGLMFADEKRAEPYI